MALITSLIQGTDFRRFLDFVTPAFFDVMPVGGLLGAARKLLGNYGNRSGFDQAVVHRAKTVAGIDLQLDRSASLVRLEDLASEQRVAIGQAVLRLYFHQLFDAKGPTLLNLGADRFDVDKGQVRWKPSAGYIEWPEEFRAALEKVYRSFYLDEAGPLEEALRPLHLSSAADLFREHFGGGGQTQVVFEVRNFINAFHQVFLHCKDQGIRLNPAFLSLGLYLATMYETLEKVGEPLNVRKAFHAALEPKAAA